LNRAITAEKQHINNVANITDLVGMKGLFKTCCCQKAPSGTKPNEQEAFAIQWAHMLIMLVPACV
jgi:hypothetical protein